MVVTRFLWGWLETVSNTEPFNNGLSKLPARVRAAAAALEAIKQGGPFPLPPFHFLQQTQYCIYFFFS